MKYIFIILSLLYFGKNVDAKPKHDNKVHTMLRRSETGSTCENSKNAESKSTFAEELISNTIALWPVWLGSIVMWLLFTSIFGCIEKTGFIAACLIGLYAFLTLGFTTPKPESTIGKLIMCFICFSGITSTSIWTAVVVVSLQGHMNP